MQARVVVWWETTCEQRVTCETPPKNIAVKYKGDYKQDRSPALQFQSLKKYPGRSLRVNERVIYMYYNTHLKRAQGEHTFVPPCALYLL